MSGIRIDHIEYRIGVQRSHAERIKQAYRNLVVIGVDNLSLDRLETRIDALNDEWMKYSVNHSAINLALSRAIFEDHNQRQRLLRINEEQYAVVYERYLEAIERMRSLLRRQTPLDLSSAASQSPPIVLTPLVTTQMPPATHSTVAIPQPPSATTGLLTTPSPSVSTPATSIPGQVITHSFYQGPRLPPIDVPKFSGNVSKWLPFKNLFNSLIVANHHLSAVQKLHYLKASLGGTAASLIQNTALTPENFQRSWDLINSFYENRRQLINAALDSLFAIRPMTRESAMELEQIYSATMQVYRTLESLQSPVHEWDHILVYIIVKRLYTDSVKAWEQHLGSSSEPPTWHQLSDFLLTRMRTLQSFENSLSTKIPVNSRRHSAKIHFASQSNGKKDRSPSSHSCPACSGNHYMSQCPKYQQKTTQQRIDLVNLKGICFNCLGYHKLAVCQSSRRCLKCGRRHHTSLHKPESRPNAKNNSPRLTPTTEAAPKQVHHAHHLDDHSATRSAVLLATAQVKVMNNHGGIVLVRALLDQGSEITLASQHLVQRLRIKCKSTSTRILGIGAQKSGKSKGLATFTIKPHFESSTEITLNAHVLPKLTSAIPSAPMVQLDWPHLKGLPLADPDFSNPGPIDLIIGADLYGQLLEGAIAKGPQNSPTAQSTKLGWIISGPSFVAPNQQAAAIYHCTIDHDLYSLLERFWHQEEIKTPSTSSKLSAQDEECEKFFKNTYRRDKHTGKYIVRLPFKKSPDLLGTSKSAALRMLHQIQKKFQNDSTYFELYSTFLREYEKLQHMVQVPDDDPEPHPVFYLPHHGVKRESSSTTKLRVVFNGSCRVNDGQSLNELLHSGPKLQKDLFDVLIWQRQHKYIFSADIEKMYRQIKVHHDDWKYQRILWKQRNNIVTYNLTTVTYGLACAPYLALRALLQLVIDDGAKFPEATEILLKGRYVDDIFGGADTIQAAQQKVQHVNQLCMAGGFPLRKWISNHPDLINTIPVEHRVSTKEISIKDQTVQALGLLWSPSSDTLHFNLSLSTSSTVTKRSVLSKIAQFFDPLGLLSPLFIKAKIFMQELWAVKLHWDDLLHAPQTQAWQVILRSMEDLDQIRIPRWLGTTPTSKVEIHGFSDASQLAMAAVVYLKTSDENNTVKISLVCSKSKVAPLKRMTIPRLELSAAVMLTKLTNHCIKTLDLSDTPCYLWTDSSIVHTWINNHPSRWKEFVHNRVCFIQETLPQGQWRHVPGTSNPADCATRGLTASELSQHDLWWTGPSWLSKDPSNWPIAPSKKRHTDQELEQRLPTDPISLHASVLTNSPEMIARYSTLQRLIRITALCKRLAQYCRKELKTPLLAPLSPEELTNATQYWVKVVQHNHFSSEIKSLNSASELSKSSPINRLLPFIDHLGLLRVGGRLKNSALSDDSKHPLILPRNSSLTDLIIRDAHRRTLHGSTQETLVFIRQNFWIIGGRAPVRSYILKCITCTRHRQAQARHIMGQLPARRVTPARAFLHSGVDYAGPYNLKVWKGRGTRTFKAWIALFVCFSTSAIHLEIVSDYTAEAFLAAFRRFTARRGICSTLTSDCGTNFKGAEKELKRLFDQSSQELKTLASTIAHDGTKWIFNPPATPHFGGKWEAGVKSMKYHLKRVDGNTLLTYEGMSTLLCQIEAILNSRPLCALTDDPDDLNVLTPGHFLIGHPLNLPPEPNLQHLQSSRLSHWQHICQMIRSFWDKWSREYLQRFLSIYKWNRPSAPVTEGALVLITDERYPPTKWPMGRIIKLHQGSDGVARVADIKTSSSIVTRPIVKLCPLGIGSSEYCSSPESTKAGGNV